MNMPRRVRDKIDTAAQQIERGLDRRLLPAISSWPGRFTWTDLLVGLILLAGLLVRLYGIDFGLPHLYDPDEPLFVPLAVRMLDEWSLNPHWFGNPGTPMLYLMAVIYVAIFAAGRVTGSFGSVADFRALYYADPTVFYLSGRILVAVIGVASIWLVYRIGKKLFDRNTALLAALFTAFNPIHVAYSKLIRTDVVMGTLVLVAFWFSIRLLEDRRWRDYLLAGFVTGLAVVTKYPAVVFAVTIIVAHLISTRWKDIKGHLKLAGSGGACLLGTFAGSPYLYLDWRTALENYRWEARTEHMGATGQGFLPDLVWFVDNGLVDSFTWVGLSLIVVGIVVCLLAKDKRKLLLPIFPLVFFLFIASLSLRWVRWVTPTLPMFGLLAAGGLVWIGKQLAGRVNTAAGTIAGVLLFAVTITPMVQQDLVDGRELSGADTRTLAQEWMLDNIPEGSRVLVEIYTPQFPKRQFVFYEVIGGELARYDPDKENREYMVPGYHIASLEDVTVVRREEIEYVVLSSKSWTYLGDPDQYPRQAAALEQLISAGEKVYEVTRTPGQNRGPTIRIYRMNTGGE